MSCEVFIPYKPHAATFKVVEQANAIIGEYLAQGFPLTLRQISISLSPAPCWKTRSRNTSASASSSATHGTAD
jgi:hypothetical protein